MTRRTLAAQSVAKLFAAQPGRAKPVLIFDANETLLDIRLREPHCERVFAGMVTLTNSAHAWDIAGAMAAGCQAAFIARPGKVLFPLAPPPASQGEDLKSIAAQLVAAYE